MLQCLRAAITGTLGACRATGVASWTFEESKAFIEVSGAVAFHAVREELHPQLLKMWGQYRTFAMYFMGYTAGQHTEAQIRAPQNTLFQAAKFAEDKLQGRLSTVLLHRALVHLPEQALQMWPTAWINESWGSVTFAEPRVPSPVTLSPGRLSMRQASV